MIELGILLTLALIGNSSSSGTLKGLVFVICISLVVTDSKLQDQRITEEASDESLNVVYEPNTNINKNLPEHEVVPDLYPNGVGDLGTENDEKYVNTKGRNASQEEHNSSNNDIEEISGGKELEKASAQSNEVVYKENLSLREILKRLMPPQLSSTGIEEAEESTSKRKSLSSPEYNPMGEEHEKDDNLLPNSGSDVSCNTSSGTSENDTLNTQENTNAKGSNTSVTKKATCIELERPDDISDVEIINATALQQFLQNNPNITNRSSPAKCFIIYFFSPYCPFSTQGSAYVNALARSLPNIPVYGIDSIEYHSPNARYGIMGTPSLVLFHNGNVAGRFNSSEFSTYHLESFIHHFTDQKLSSINVTSQDFKSNLPSQTLRSTPYALYFAWAFLLTCGGYLFLNSNFYATLMEAFVNNWREAEAQHEHDD